MERLRDISSHASSFFGYRQMLAVICQIFLVSILRCLSVSSSLRNLVGRFVTLYSFFVVLPFARNLTSYARE